MMKKALLILSFGTGILSAQTSTFITDGDWLDPANWDTGAVVPDNQTAFINANAVVDRNTGNANVDNPSRIEIGSGPGISGSVTVTGGTLSGAHGGGNGIFVGVNGGTGTLRVEEGATYRSQGGTMQFAVGDFLGGTGFVSVAGVMQIYKFQILQNLIELLILKVYILLKLSYYESEIIAELNFGDIERNKIQRKSVNEALKMSLSLIENS